MSKPKQLPLPQLEKSSIVFEESIIKIKKDILSVNDHTYSYYTLLTSPASVVILATTENGEYLLTEEYRHPTNQLLLGCPGGYLDGEEVPEEAAARELIEETGFQAENFVCLGSAFPYAGMTGQRTFFVRAWNAKQVQEPHVEPSEILRPVLKTKEEIDYLIDQGISLDANLCSALFFDKRKQI